MPKEMVEFAFRSRVELLVMVLPEEMPAVLNVPPFSTTEDANVADEPGLRINEPDVTVVGPVYVNVEFVRVRDPDPDLVRAAISDEVAPLRMEPA